MVIPPIFGRQSPVRVTGCTGCKDISREGEVETVVWERLLEPHPVPYTPIIGCTSLQVLATDSLPEPVLEVLQFLAKISFIDSTAVTSQ